MARTEGDDTFFRRVVSAWLVFLTLGLLATMYLVYRFDQDSHKTAQKTIQHATDADARIQALEKKVAAMEAQQKASAPAKP